MWRATWAEVDLDRFTHNVGVIRRLIGSEVRLLAAVKAAAYGHGAVEISRAAVLAGADYLGVASYEEGVELRQAGIMAPILVFGAFTPAAAVPAIGRQLTATVSSAHEARALADAARAQKAVARVHVKTDTGMTRLGVRGAPATLSLLKAVSDMPGIMLEGLYTHYAAADELDGAFTDRQRQRFEEIVLQARRAGVVIPIVHAANSAGTLRGPEHHYDMVRPGIALYGYHPAPAWRQDIDLRPVLTLKTRIVRLADIEPGETVSYGYTYTAKQRVTIATLPVGYADGIPRALSNVGTVCVNGQPARIAGRVCMDQMMVEVPGHTVHVGDEVTVYGRSGDCGSLSAAALQLDTIPYELLCRISARVPRIAKAQKNNEET